ncbi:MAG TPA: sugar phosphate nucleotidyltransferase [Paenibacillus sp.]
MRIVLLSGGAGKRLWPLSNEGRSKPFLRVMHDQTGRKLSMIQNTMDELEAIGCSDRTLIVASDKHIQQVHEHLGDSVQSLVEPRQRDTFPAVALAATYLHDELGAAREEVMVVMPVDGHANSSFYRFLPMLAQGISDSNEAKLGLIGVKPLSASVKYGYIVPEAVFEVDKLLPIHKFQEKPDEQTAQALIEQGALWNCGVFAFTVGYLLDLLQARGYPQDYASLNETYDELPARSFDYEVSEREGSGVCLPYEGHWTDMGTWDGVFTSMKEPLYGYGLLNGDCNGTHVINELSIPMVVSDIPNAFIIAGQEGILISSKGSSSDIKQVLHQLSEISPSVEMRTGGRCSLLDRQAIVDHGITIETSRIHIPSAGKLTTHSKAIKTVWTLLTGSGNFVPTDLRQDEFQCVEGQSFVLQEAGRFTASAECLLIEIATLDNGELMDDKELL